MTPISARSSRSVSTALPTALSMLHGRLSAWIWVLIWRSSRSSPENSWVRARGNASDGVGAGTAAGVWTAAGAWAAVGARTAGAGGCPSSARWRSAISISA